MTNGKNNYLLLIGTTYILSQNVSIINFRNSYLRLKSVLPIKIREPLHPTHLHPRRRKDEGANVFWVGVLSHYTVYIELLWGLNKEEFLRIEKA
jgi:hypothetical protein